MNRRLTAVAAAITFALLVLTGCTSPGSGTSSPAATAPAPPASSHLMPSSAVPSQPPAQGTRHSRTPAPTASPSRVPGLVVVHDPGQVTGTLHGPCHVRGQLPDPACTSGAIDPAITAALLCSGHYSTRTYRPPESQTQAFKYDEAYPAYGIPASTRTELDHLVSLELGGANDAANLWPEIPPTPNPKDTVENALHAWVCAVSGAASQDRLRKAQLAIAGNWTTAEQVLGIPA